MLFKCYESCHFVPFSARGKSNLASLIFALLDFNISPQSVRRITQLLTL